MTAKRLFIFAAYDPMGECIDDSVILYVQELAKMGDVIFYMDNDIPATELDKIKPFVLFAGASRHGEYDFGSYKRGYIMARDADIFKNYDYVYMANDSVYAPLCPIRPLIEQLESAQTDASGMVLKSHKKSPHLQSWFIGMGPRVFLSDWFDTFIGGVKKLSNKCEVAVLYEHGFTKNLIQRNLSFTSLFQVRKHAIYNDIKGLFKRGLPFMKKVSFNRLHGALGRQISYILSSIDPVLRTAILHNAMRLHGQQNVKTLLTNNPFKIAWRYIKHLFYKLFMGGI